MGTLTIRGWIRLPSPQPFHDAVAIVGLDDVTRIDAPSVRIAEIIIDPICGLRDRIPFCLTAEESLLASGSYVLTAEIRRSGKRALSRGDFLTTAAVPWTVGNHGDKVEVLDVNQI
jgi:uncharacterized lipoprotein YbaY